MTAAAVLIYLAATLLSGAVVTGLVELQLTLEERAALALMIGIAGGTVISFCAALLLGMSWLSVLAGPVLLGGIGLAASPLLQAERRLDRWGRPWRESWQEARRRWGGWRSSWPLLAGAALIVVLVALLFAHSVFEQGGNLDAGYPTVWADWSQHLTTETSFALGHNLPPDNPLFSGTALLYPFMAGFHSAMLMTLGLGPGAALALPSAVLFLAVILLVVALALRLHISAAAGLIAAAICFLGGGLGFVGVFADACAHHGFSADRCSLGHLVGSPRDAVSVVAGTLHDLPGVIAAQPRSYDGLLTPEPTKPLPNIQWYTPLFAWWLPQRPILYGFGLVLCVLILVLAALRARPGSAWTPFVVAGVLAGLLPVFHVHSLIVLAIVLPATAVLHRRREWLGLLLACAVIAAPRLVQLAFGPHGAASTGNAFPTLEPGWKWYDAASDGASGQGGSLDVSLASAGEVVLRTLRLPITPGYWKFWLVNLGLAVPLCVAVVLAVVARSVRRRVGARRSASGEDGGQASEADAGAAPVAALAGAMGRFAQRASDRLVDAFPPELMRFCLPFMLIFGIANVVVFQSWDWDNTKLFAYWYLAFALLAGALSVRLWGAASRHHAPRPRRWPGPEGLRLAVRRGVAAGGVATIVATGVLVVLRLLPWTPSEYSSSRPIVFATADERRLAQTLIQRTPATAVFLTSGRPNDPVLTLGGRRGVMGYYGWLWSYGTSFGTRPEDVDTMYAGCPEGVSCALHSLLTRYRISFVEVDDRFGDPGANQHVNLAWWSAQRLPVVARSEHIVIYDVRNR